MVGGTGFEPVTPTMSILDIEFDGTFAFNEFNNLAEAKFERCCSLVVRLGLSWHCKWQQIGNRTHPVTTRYSPGDYSPQSDLAGSG